jgi:SWI/SNF-related matrix-associated actin-dependent regulator 1 of chromatin subfamily A
MNLDYHAGNFILRFARGEASPQVLMNEHGFDFSLPASTAAEAVLFTPSPYAAVAFAKHATPAAKGELDGILKQIAASFAPTSLAHIKCPDDRELWPFQVASVDYALQRQHTLVGDQPGLGKTPIAICFANETQAKRVLVVCPASIRLQWVRRIREWSTMPRPFHIHCIDKGRRGAYDPKMQYLWTVVSYDLASADATGAALAAGTYDLMILDEGHYVKTIDIRRTRAIFGGGHPPPPFAPLHTRVGSILALTGTPLPNRPREAYTLARGLCFDAIDWASEDKFRERYNPSMRGVSRDGNVYIDERTGRHAELQARLRAHFMVRHLKHEVLPQLGYPDYDIIQVTETGAVKQALQAEKLLDIDPEDLEGCDATVLGHIAAARRLMGVAMAPQVAEYANMLIDGGEEKLVIFGWHIEVLDILEKALQRHGTIRIDGRTGPAAKEKLIGDFIRNPRTRVAIGNILSMGVGTDGLQEVACHALIAEPDWVTGQNQQCVDRLHRGGQKRSVQADFFVAPNSLAEKVLASALRKGHIIDAALDRRP